MTLTIKTPIALVLTGILAFQGCTLKQMIKMSKDQKLTVTPSPIEAHADSVIFDLSASLPVKMLKKNKIYTVNTFYKYGDQKLDLGKVEFKSSDFPNAKTEEPQASKKFSFAYTPAITNGDVVVVGSASNLNLTKSKATPELPIAKGIITTSRLVKDIYFISYAEHGYNNREELIPNRVEFYFDQGSAKLKVKETGGKKGKYVDAFVAKKNITRTVSIIGEHSPEGREIKNAKLSEERAKAIEKFYKARLKKYSKKGEVDSISFVTKGIVQDWESLKKTLDTTDFLSPQEESEIMALTKGGGTFEEKEKAISRLPSYKKLFTKVYPILRTAKTEILTIKPKKTDTEIYSLAQGISKGTVSPDSLKDEELSYAATLTKDLQEKEAIYTAATKKNDSWASHNNLGAVYLEYASQTKNEAEKLKYAEKAETQFNLSLKGKENAEAHANLAVVHLIRGARVLGIDEANKATQTNASDRVKKGAYGTKGVLEIKHAQYDAAIQSLSKSNETPEVVYNTALANLLKKNFSAAKAGFESAKTAAPNDGWSHYASAVTAARLKDAAGVNANLKKAIQLDPKLSEKASADLEFAEYWAADDFKSALK
jgi:hypothetical protein